MRGSQVKAQPSSGSIFHARSCVRKDSPSDSMEIMSDCTKRGHTLARWRRGKTDKPFLHHVMSDNNSDVQNPTYLVSHEPPNTFGTGIWVCMGLDCSTCSECLPVDTCDFEPPEHVPRNSARAQTRAVVFGWALCVPWSREKEKRPAAGREKCRC